MLERLAGDEHSSLLQKFVNYGHKKFYKIGAVRGVRQVRRQIGRRQDDQVVAVGQVVQAGPTVVLAKNKLERLYKNNYFLTNLIV